MIVLVAADAGLVAHGAVVTITESKIANAAATLPRRRTILDLDFGAR
jgi:aromatic ring hydroxylase